MRIFVTGGSGFIGSAVVSSLIARGFSVANFDIKRPSHPEHDRFWVHGDLLDHSALCRAVAKFRPDAIIHLAAKADISSTNWEDFASIHVGTQNLIAAIENCDAVRSLVNISTQLVIGPQHEPRSLTDFRPYTIYGEAKAFAEGLLFQWTRDVCWATVRPANIWGPQHPTFASEIWKYIAQRRYLHPSGAPVYRSYGFVENTADQIIAIALAEPRDVDRRIFYAADEVIDSAIWVDEFAMTLTGNKARRVPSTVLKSLGLAGEVLKRTGLRVPIDSGRAMRMTESYEVPLADTYLVCGQPRVGIATGVAKTATWLRSLGGVYAGSGR